MSEQPANPELDLASSAPPRRTDSLQELLPEAETDIADTLDTSAPCPQPIEFALTNPQQSEIAASRVEEAEEVAEYETRSASEVVAIIRMLVTRDAECYCWPFFFVRCRSMRGIVCMAVAAVWLVALVATIVAVIVAKAKF